MFDDVFAQLANPVKEPDWRLPNDHYILEARQFIDPANRDKGGMDLDEAVAVRLIRLEMDGDFHAYRAFMLGDRKLVVPPEQTVPGMTGAARALSEALECGEKVAVFCDYDVDGTSAGAALRLGLRPYLSSEDQLVYGYADAQRGFGLTNEFVKKAAEAGCKVLVTADCGSGQVEQVRLAQSLGMRVIVVDHHDVDPGNPADHHLNPHLHEPQSTHNTGAQLAWKLAAAVQMHREGRTREEHWQTAMYLAGMGCLADRGSVMLPENRAFFWAPAEHPAPGVEVLAEMLGEDPRTPGMVLTQAVLNLPKRTVWASAADVGALLTADTREEAEPIARKLLAAYERAKPEKERMVEAALAQTGEKKLDRDGNEVRPGPDELMAVALVEGFEETAGYTGPAASAVASKTGKHTLIGAVKGKDELGQTIVKWSTRPASGIRAQLGELRDYEPMRKACTLKIVDEAGEVVEKPILGGHEEVVSGSCTLENWPKVKQAVKQWSAECYASGKNGWFSDPWDGPDAYVSARKVAPERLAKIEQDARLLGPFDQKRQLFRPEQDGRGEIKISNPELNITIIGTLSELAPDPENENWLMGELRFDNGDAREVRFPADEDDRPVGERCEWLLRVGRPGPYYLRQFHRPTGA